KPRAPQRPSSPRGWRRSASMPSPTSSAAGWRSCSTLPASFRRASTTRPACDRAGGGGKYGERIRDAAGCAGTRVILVGDGSEAGGSLLRALEQVAGRPAGEWAAERVAELRQLPQALLQRTTAF